MTREQRERTQRAVILANSLALECLIQLGYNPWQVMEDYLNRDEPDSCRKPPPSPPKREKM